MQVFAFILLLTILIPCASSVEVAVAGTVYDANTGLAIEHATVSFSSTVGMKSSVTDSDGSYSVSLMIDTVGVDAEAQPDTFVLNQNYPNPFNPSTVIEYELTGPAIVNLNIYSITGQRVRALENGYFNTGHHSSHWDGCDDNGRKLSAGIYLYRLSAGNTVQTRKMLMIDGGSFGTGAAVVSMGQLISAAKPSYLTYDISVAKDGYATYTEAGFAPSISAATTEKDYYLSSEEMPMRKIMLAESSDDFPNPERGFYAHTVLNTLPSDDWLAALKDENITIIYTEVNAEDYREKDFDQDYLDNLSDQFARIRKAGLKSIFNVVYAHNVGEPDAAKEQIFRHIEQLKPLVDENWDVIYVAKTGYIGPWGEMHSSTNDLDSPENITAILNKVLGIFPVERIVMLRTPIMKVNAFDNELMTLERAHDGSRLARVGFFNDCFLASETDYGTYTSEKNRAAWIEYIANEAKYTVFGGETCKLNYLAECDNTIYEMEQLAMSWLNRGWHPDVRANWEAKGCLSEIMRRLGYRLVMREVSVPESIQPGGIFQVSLKLDNMGFAAPVNPRNVELVLRNNVSGTSLTLPINTDPRFWFAGETQGIKRQMRLPDDLAPGGYTLLMKLSDPCEKLSADSRYSIRLANNGVWEADTGMNVLTNDIVISPK